VETAEFLHVCSSVGLFIQYTMYVIKDHSPFTAALLRKKIHSKIMTNEKKLVADDFVLCIFSIMFKISIFFIDIESVAGLV
jgi:hypothetical protein